MKSFIIVGTLLVSILGVISKDLPVENDVEIEESEMLADEDTLDLVFDRRGKQTVCKQWKKCCQNSRDFDKNHRGLVITGGDDQELQTSSELISFLGVCGSPNIPELPEATTAGKSVWFKDSLFFCGGSRTYIAGESNQNLWGATDKCLKAKPGDSDWKTHPHFDMNHKRSWFSLNNNGNSKIVAAGGLGEDGTIRDTLEQYSKGVWRMMNHITLDYPVYGHCGVQYTSGGNSYLMLIAGSNGDWSDPTNRVTLINLDTGDAVDVNPGPMSPLWAPACTIHGQDIYVTGGAIDDIGDPSASVYKYNLNTGVFTQSLGYLTVPRWGHTLGVTSKNQLVVAGGYNGGHLTSVEVSEDGGDTWNEWSTELSVGAEYAAMAPVPNHLLKCQ